MEDTKRVVVWEKEWAPVRRFFRSVIDGHKQVRSLYHSTKQATAEGYDSLVNVSQDTYRDTKNIVKNTYEEYPYVIVGTFAVLSALATRRFTKTTFGVFRNAALGAGLATATLYPQQLVNMTLRPQQFFDNAYSTALKATVTQVEKPKWEEFKEKAEAVEEAIVEKVENAEQAVVHTAAEITEHIKEQAKEDATAIVENLQAVAEHVTEVVKQEGTDLPTEKNE